MSTEPESAGKDGASQPPSERRQAGRALLALAIATILFGLLFVLFIGRWLVVEDPVETAQAIAVLSGGLPDRAVEAARLYRSGYAPAVWLTHPSEPAETLESMGIAYNSEDFYDTKVLVSEGVPESAIRVLHPAIVNTTDEVLAISEALKQQPGKTVIIVTSRPHTRRTRILWHKLAFAGGRAIVRAPSQDPFEGGHWWRTTKDALDVVRETLGILNAWAGFPLHPAK